MAARFERIVLEQIDVFVHAAVPSSLFNDNIIRGKVIITEQDGDASLVWEPVNGYEFDTNVNDEPLLTGEQEWRLVSTQSSSGSTSVSYSKAKDTSIGGTTSDSNKLYLSFPLKDLRSLNRSDPKLAWSYVIFILKSGASLPALHFHSGGIETLIKTMSRYIWLTRSPISPKRYIVQENSSAVKSPFHQLQLDDDKPSDMISKLMNNTYYGALNNLSKVTRFVLGSSSHYGIQETRPVPLNVEGDDAIENDFEMVIDEPVFPIDAIIPSARSEPLQPEEWCSYFDNDGRVINVVQLKEKIFRGGLHPDVRREGWKFLLGYYDFNSTYKQRDQRREDCKIEYHVMKQQWMTISDDQAKRFAEFNNRKQLVDKDTLRTDRNLPFFAGEDNPNVAILFNVLMTYCMYNFDLGYVQGMSDILSPILILMENEEDAFWCFTGLMQMEERNFEFVQQYMQNQLLTLGKMIKFFFPRFHIYLERNESANLFFCFRWLLINFKREFKMEDTMTLWEALWTQQLTPHFNLFIALTILERERDYMIKSHFGFTEIVKHINELPGRIDLPFVLSRAESICLSLKQTPDLPPDIKQIADFNLALTNDDGSDITDVSNGADVQITDNDNTATNNLIDLQHDSPAVFS